MNFAGEQLTPQVAEKEEYLPTPPAHSAGQEEQMFFGILQEAHLRELADFFKAGILGPAANWRLEIPFVYVDDAGLLERRTDSALLVHLKGPPSPAPALDEELSPLAYGHAVREGPIVVLEVRRQLKTFDETARLACHECVPYKRLLVIDAT